MIAVHIDSGEISVRRVAVPDRPPGFSLVRPLLAGICNTDLELLRGYYSFAGIPGHEFVGIVVASDRSDLVGRRVVGEINLACGECQFCTIGLGRHCLRRTVLGIVNHPGAFAEFFTLPDANLHVVPEEIPDSHAVFVEPLAAACEILDQVRIPDGESVAVLGDGKLGLLVAQVLQAHDARVTLYGRHEGKLSIARKIGVEGTTSSDRPAMRYPVVIECTGSVQGLDEAVKMTLPRGTVVMKSTVHGRVPLDAASVIVHEITLIGSRCGRFEPAIELLRTGKIDVGSMLSAEYPLDQAPAAFSEASRPGVLKVLLCPPQDARTS